MPVAVFYISGHGYGHAVRSAEVIRQLVARDAGWKVHVCTTAPRQLFLGIPEAALKMWPVTIDSGIVESSDALSIDAAATAARVEPFLRAKGEIVNAGAQFVRSMNADVVVADIPYLAGEIGGAAGLPVVGISNFTWDYIFEPFLATHDEGRRWLAAMRAGYDQLTCLLRLPFHHDMPFACEVQDVGLVAAKRTVKADEVLERLEISADDRPRVLVSWRAAFPCDAIRRAVESSPDYLFLYSGDVVGRAPENLRHLPVLSGLSYADIASACQVVVAKLGYGTVSSSVACGVDLLFPPREGFREDELLKYGAREYLRCQEIPLAKFFSGNWAPYLEALRSLPRPVTKPAMEGAKQCAGLIAKIAAGRGG